MQQSKWLLIGILFICIAFPYENKFSYNNSGMVSLSNDVELIDAVDGYTRLARIGDGHTTELGMPELPQFSTYFQLDPSKTYEFEFEVLDSYIIENINILPHQGMEKWEVKKINILNDEVYNSYAPYPSENMMVSDRIQGRGIEFINISFEILNLTEGAVFGVIVILLLKSISIQEAYESINWSVIFLLAALVPISIAIQNTGADKLLGDFIIFIANILSGFIQSENMLYLSLLYFFTFTLSAFISNAAVAIIIAPVGIYLAAQLNIDPRPFLIAICFGASNSFMTPVGYQTNLMVFAPGQYKFKDFIVAGLPLTIVFWLLATYLIPKFWPII